MTFFFAYEFFFMMVFILLVLILGDRWTKTPHSTYSRYFSHGNTIPQFSHRDEFLSLTAKYLRDVILRLSNLSLI